MNTETTPNNDYDLAAEKEKWAIPIGAHIDELANEIANGNEDDMDDFYERIEALAKQLPNETRWEHLLEKYFFRLMYCGSWNLAEYAQSEKHAYGFHVLALHLNTDIQFQDEFWVERWNELSSNESSENPVLRFVSSVAHYYNVLENPFSEEETQQTGADDDYWDNLANPRIITAINTAINHAMRLATNDEKDMKAWEYYLYASKQFVAAMKEVVNELKKAQTTT